MRAARADEGGTSSSDLRELDLCDRFKKKESRWSIFDRVGHKKSYNKSNLQKTFETSLLFRAECHLISKVHFLNKHRNFGLGGCFQQKLKFESGSNDKTKNVFGRSQKNYKLVTKNDVKRRIVLLYFRESGMHLSISLSKKEGLA